MVDVLGNEVTNFVENNVDNITKTKESKSRYYHSTLVDYEYYHIRVENKHGHLIGWNKLLREVVDGKGKRLDT